MAQNKKGFTLVESIVSFMLLGIFMVASTGAITSFSSIHVHITSMNRANSIAYVLLDDITHEISGMSEASEPPNATEKTYGITKIDNNFSELTYVDENGNPAVLGVTDSLLNIHYKAVTDGEKMQEAVDWHYSKKMYMGNKVTKFIVAYESDRLYKVTLELTNDHSGYKFETTRYIKCYNLPLQSKM